MAGRRLKEAIMKLQKALFLAAGAASAQTIDVDEQRTAPLARRYLHGILKLLLALSFAVPGFAPAWASHEGSELAVPPGPGFRGGGGAGSHPPPADARPRDVRSGVTALRPPAGVQIRRQ